MYRSLIKPLFDRTAAALLLLGLGPLFVVLVLLTGLIQGWGQVWFFQARVGYKGRPFWLFKFKTMRDEPDATKVTGDAERITPWGAFLRRWSLDELPQLVNVLMGDMSLVGPRPLPVEYVPHFSLEQNRRHDVKPGLTGLAQVSGRNNTTWEQRFAQDLRYVDTMSLGQDLRILGQTVRYVLTGSGLQAQAHLTMKPFQGQDPAQMA